jgi:diguanylate cyclase (GGDEF)-like protein
VLWLDDRWTLVELGCAFSGMLVAAVLRSDPNLGLAGLAPLLFAAFALRWPELNWHARIDPKTGLPNAWHWEERTRELLTAAEARGIPVTVMIIDIDRFKLVNDTYGHLIGDRVLNNLADALRSEARPGDLLGRFGGEEFVVTMFGPAPAVAAGAAERIRSRVAGQRHPLSDGPAPETCGITCTIGLASSTAHGYDLTRLLDLADIALAAGKAGGRNQIRDARSVLADIGIDGDVHVGPRSRSLLSVVTRPRTNRRTLRHGPGSMFR